MVWLLAYLTKRFAIIALGRAGRFDSIIIVSTATIAALPLRPQPRFLLDHDSLHDHELPSSLRIDVVHMYPATSGVSCHMQVAEHISHTRRLDLCDP